MVSWVGVYVRKLDKGEVTHWAPMPEGPKND